MRSLSQFGESKICWLIEGRAFVFGFCIKYQADRSALLAVDNCKKCQVPAEASFFGWYDLDVGLVQVPLDDGVDF